MVDDGRRIRVNLPSAVALLTLRLCKAVAARVGYKRTLQIVGEKLNFRMMTWP